VKLTVTNQRGRKGAMAAFFSGGIQIATQLDANGQTFREAFPAEWAYIALQTIRSPNGTEIYSIVNTSDADVREVLDVMIPFKGCRSDVTWPPQLDPVTDIQAMTSSATQRLVFGNEPPSHIPTVWADGAAYATEAKTWYDALSSANQAIAWEQTGKPEVIRYSLTGATGIAKHQDCLDELSTKVKAGDLPARIATTHKLNDGYITDRTTFYQEMVSDYKTYFGNDVKLLFHEYKLKSSLVDNLEQLQLVMEFWLVMARLKFQEGDTIEGGCFQQLAGVGTTNIFGMDNTLALGGIWRLNMMYYLFNIARPMYEQPYIYTEQTGRPTNVQAEMFGTDKKRWTFFNNFGNRQELSTDGQKLTYIDSGLTVKTKQWDGFMPANSVGVVEGNIVPRQRSRFFYFLRNLMSSWLTF